MTPNSRRLLSSPGEWLKQAINPNTADPTFIQSFKKHKVKREFNHVHLLQEVQGHVGAVWTAQISPDGKYFLSGGKDLKLNLYSIAMPDDGTNSILHHRCTYEGHSGDILCVSWAMNSQAFVSASMDKTVRLWKVPAKAVVAHKEAAVVEESVVFEHADFVTSVAFHPNGEWFVWAVSTRSCACGVSAIAACSSGWICPRLSPAWPWRRKEEWSFAGITRAKRRCFRLRDCAGSRRFMCARGAAATARARKLAAFA
jgi:WD40 repeat protein